MSDLFRTLERSMGMSDAVWRRHANPLSVYTRIPILPVLALAVWSRVWLGIWALIPVGLVVLWTWINPRVFPIPSDLNNWASRGVLGERVFLKRRADIDAHHRIWATGLGFAALPGALIMIVGLWQLNPAWAVFGTVLTMVPKLWFLDRMNWLYADWLHAENKELGDV